jgi:hypothetical protein
MRASQSIGLALAVLTGCFWSTGEYAETRRYVVEGRGDVVSVGREPTVTLRRAGDDLAVHVELHDSCRRAERGAVRVDEEATRTFYIIPYCAVAYVVLLPLVFGGFGGFSCGIDSKQRRERTIAAEGTLWAEPTHHPCRDAAGAPAAGLAVGLEIRIAQYTLHPEARATTDAAGDALLPGAAHAVARVSEFCSGEGIEPASVSATVASDLDARAETTEANRPQAPLRGLWAGKSAPLSVAPAGAARDWSSLDPPARDLVAGCAASVPDGVCRDAAQRAYATWASTACGSCVVGCGNEAECEAGCHARIGTLGYAGVQQCVNECFTAHNACVDKCACKDRSPANPCARRAAEP